MININNKYECSGCHACMNICPQNCITMKSDNEGFFYPEINKSQCINCNLCERVCKIYNNNKINNAPVAYAAFSKDDNIRSSSSSGGIFSHLAEFILENNGVVFGAAFNDNLFVEHIFIENKEDLYRLRGSKYVQSTVGKSYKQVENFLKSGRLVLYTGTPCQVDGLLLYLGKEYENLYTQDIICHGVPSPKIWSLYMKFLENKYNSKINHDNPPLFRNKKNGWRKFNIRILFENNSEHSIYFKEDIYFKGFLGNLTLRPSCYKCQHKTINRKSDITLADFWGVQNICPDLCADKGISLVVLNSEKGKKIFEIISDKIFTEKVNLSDALIYNYPAIKSVPKPISRKKLFRKINSLNFEETVNYCLKQEKKLKFYFKIKNYIKRIIR